MSGPTFADVDSFGQLKELYADDSYYQENIRSSFFNFIRHASPGEVEFDGKNFNVFAKLQLNESYAALNDGERLPDSGIPKSVPAQYRSKLMYSGVEITTYAATRGHKNGRVDGKYIDDMVKGTLMTFMSNLDFDALGNGRGFRADIQTATPAATSFTVRTSAMLRPGMKLDWYDSTYATKRGSIMIALKSVDRINRIVYIDTGFGSAAVPAGAVAGDKLVVYGALAPNEPSDGRHMLGYQRMVDPTLAIGGLSPSDYAAWLPVVLNAAGANPSQENLQIIWDQMDQIGSSYPNRMAFNQAWKRGYLNQFLAQRRFTSNVYDTGASSIGFSPTRMGPDEKQKKVPDHKMLEDKNVDPAQTLIFNDGAFCFASDYSNTPHLADEDGSDFCLKLGFDAMAGFYRFWGNNVVYQRNLIGYVYNQAVASGVI